MRLFYFLCFLFPSFCLQAQSTVEMYISKFDSLAIEVFDLYGIPASIVLGVALHESGAATSKLCRVNHNHFGIKGYVRSSKSKSGYVYTYRNFESDEAAYQYFGEMVSKKKYYPGLKGNIDYLKWLKAMKAAHYAMSPHWISRVDQIIKRYNLAHFDSQVPDPIRVYPSTSDSTQVYKN